MTCCLEAWGGRWPNGSEIMRRVVIAAVAVWLSGQAAHAHAFLERAIPAVGSDVADPPATLTLTYTEPVEAAFSFIHVIDGAGTRVDAGTSMTRGDGRMLQVDLKPLPPGTYRVEWHVTSVDTHKTDGHFTFTVMP